MIAPELLSIFILFGLILAMGALYGLAGRRAPEEAGKPRLYESRCRVISKRGIAVGGGSVPITRVALYESMIVIRLLTPHVVHRRDVRSLSTSIRSGGAVVKVSTEHEQFDIWCGDPRLAELAKRELTPDRVTWGNPLHHLGALGCNHRVE
jgi:hypothetical protein